MKYGLGLDWIPALLIGVILANTDTVSMIAVFKEIRVPSRLSIIVEGRILFNDAAALVTFNLISIVYATGSLTVVQPDQALENFARYLISDSGIPIGTNSLCLFVAGGAALVRFQLIAAKAAQDELDSLLKSGVLPKAVDEELWASYQARVAQSERVLRDLHNQYRAGQFVLVQNASSIPPLGIRSHLPSLPLPDPPC